MHYYLNTKRQNSNSGSNCEIHKYFCEYCHPYSSNFLDLGYLPTDKDALLKTKIIKKDLSAYIDGCKYCCPLIHKK